jgi:hypothetical protein
MPLTNGSETYGFDGFGSATLGGGAVFFVVWKTL